MQTKRNRIISKSTQKEQMKKSVNQLKNNQKNTQEQLEENQQGGKGFFNRLGAIFLKVHLHQHNKKKKTKNNKVYLQNLVISLKV